LKDTRPDELAALVVRAAVERAGISPEMVEDVILGCAFPEASQGMNVARNALLRAGLPVDVPGMTINRFCSSGLQAIAIAAERVMVGAADIIVAGGVESMSYVPMGGFNFSPHPGLTADWPEVYINMGLTAEKVAEKYGVSREDQDRFALESHRRAWAAIQAGKFREEILPVRTRVRRVGKDGRQNIEEIVFEQDESVRPDTSMEALARLKPVFRVNGTVTAGNSSPRNDGAAAVVVMSARKAEELGLKPRLLYRGFQVAGVPPEIMGIGPVKAVPRLLKKTGVRLQDVDLIELNEAFAAQSLAVIRELELDPQKVNVNGGAIALGHPLGATGAKLTVTLMHEMERQNAHFGIVTMCIGGGMGAAGLFERIS
jgi:acetyl-CoA acyltransferase